MWEGWGGCEKGGEGVGGVWRGGRGGGYREGGGSHHKRLTVRQVPGKSGLSTGGGRTGEEAGGHDLGPRCPTHDYWGRGALVLGTPGARVPFTPVVSWEHLGLGCPNQWCPQKGSSAP